MYLDVDNGFVACDVHFVNYRQALSQLFEPLSIIAKDNSSATYTKSNILSGSNLNNKLYKSPVDLLF